MAEKTIQMNQWNGSSYDQLFPNVKPVGIPDGLIAPGTNVSVSRDAATGIITINAADSATLQILNFDNTGWLASDSPLGALMKVLTMPSGKVIIGVFQTINGKNYAFGNFSENTIYANVAFSGYVKLG